MQILVSCDVSTAYEASELVNVGGFQLELQQKKQPDECCPPPQSYHLFKTLSLLFVLLTPLKIL